MQQSYEEQARGDLLEEGERIASNEILVYSPDEGRLGLYLPKIKVNDHEYRTSFQEKNSPFYTPNQWKTYFKVGSFK